LSKTGLNPKLLLEKHGQLSEGNTRVIPAPSLAGVDPKIARSLIRAYNKELRLRHSAEQMALAKEIGLGSLAAVIYSGGQIVKSGVEGVLDVEAGIASNPDPVAQGVAIAGQITGLIWFATTPLGKLIFRFAGLGDPGQIPGAIGSGISKILGRDDANGLYGVGITSDDERSYVLNFWYSNPQSRDAALIILALEHPLHAEKVDRTGNAVDGFLVPATAYSRAHPPPHQPWAVVWAGDQFTKGPVVVGYWPNQETAITQSRAYDKLYNRTTTVEYRPN